MIKYFHTNIELDRINRSNLEDIREIRNSYEIRKWARQKDLIHEEEQELWYKRQMEDPTIQMYTIKDMSEDRLVGVCGLTDIDTHNRRAEFSIYVRPALQKRGFGGLALNELFAHAFYSLNLNSVWGETFDGNPAIHLFQALGMKHDGTRREFYFHEGKMIDCHLYSMTFAEYTEKFYNEIDIF